MTLENLQKATILKNKIEWLQENYPVTVSSLTIRDKNKADRSIFREIPVENLGKEQSIFLQNSDKYHIFEVIKSLLETGSSMIIILLQKEFDKMIIEAKKELDSL